MDCKSCKKRPHGYSVCRQLSEKGTCEFYEPKNPDVCPVCGSKNFTESQLKTRKGKNGEFYRKCLSCGKIRTLY